MTVCVAQALGRDSIRSPGQALPRLGVHAVLGRSLGQLPLVEDLGKCVSGRN